MRKFIYTLVILAFVSSVSAQWVQVPNGMGATRYVACLASNTSYTFAGLKTIGGIYRTNDNGNVWTQTALANYDVNSLAISGNYLFVGTEVSGIYRSSDNGNSFTQVVTNAIIGYGAHLSISGSYIFAGTDLGVNVSTNNGNNWTQTSLSNIEVSSFAISGSNVFAGTRDSGIYLSTNNGTNWSKKSPNYFKVRAIVISGSNIFAGDITGVKVSTNNGNNWTQTSMTAPTSALIISGNNIFAGTTPGGIFQSTNNGTSWITRNEGLIAPMYNFALLIANNFILTGMEGQSAWRRPLSEVIGIQNISTEIPSAFSLSQNYPNPFNPTTKIRFDVAPSLSFPNVSIGGHPLGHPVKLIVYDIMGREVQTLVNESLKPGTYETSFDGSQLTSGVYFYKIVAGDFVETKKMLLIK